MQKVRAGLAWGRASLLCMAAAAAVIRPDHAMATLRFGDLQLSGDLSAQNLVRTKDIDQYQLVQQRNTARVRVDYDWVKNGLFIGKYDVSFIDTSRLYLLYRGVYDSIYDTLPGGNLTDVNGHRDGGKFRDIPSGARDALKFENTLREAYIDVSFKHIPLSLRLGRQQIVWGETDNFRLLDRVNPLDLTWHLQQETEIGHGWDQLRIPLWMIKALYNFEDLAPLTNAFLETYWNPGDWYPAKRRFLPDSPWSLPTKDPIGPLFPNGLEKGRLFRQGDYERTPADNSQVGVRFNAVYEGVQFTLDYFYQRWAGDDGTDAAFIKADLDPVTAAAAQRAGKLPGEFIAPYIHTFGFSANYFDADYTEAVLKTEQIYDMGVPFNDGDKPSPVLGPLIFGVTNRDMWKGMIGFDRPTWIRPLNKGQTFLFLGQFFWHYLLDNERFVGNQRGFVGAFGPPTAPLQPNGKAVDRVRDWEVLATLAVTTFYGHGTIAPQLTYGIDPVNSYNQLVAWSCDYFVTNDFIVNLAQRYYINTTDAPVFETWGLAGVNRGRSETQLRLTYQF